jgi:hypothetical protein
MRWPIAAVIAFVLTGWVAGGEAQACRCYPPSHPTVHPTHLMMHRTTVRHALYGYAGCPIALAHEIRQGCNTYSLTYVGIR